LFATVIPKKLVSRELDASVGASGPHGFAVRKISAFVNALLASTASRSNVRDDRETPLCVGRDGERYAGDLGRKGIKIFLRKGLDDPPNQQTDKLPECANETSCVARERLRTRIAATLVSPNGRMGIRR
jgi:hypothetical protein